MTHARAERAAFVATLLDVGPDAPTMCEGWTTRDLAAHVVVRESRLDAAPGITIPFFAGYTENVRARTAAGSWTGLVMRLADGPPWFSPMKPLDRWLNLSEMFVHHEDVLRGGADPNGPWTPRVLDDGLQDALRGAVRSAVMLAMTNVPAAVTLATTEGVVLATVGRGEPVTVTGTPGELLLFAFGRAPVDVRFSGSGAAIEALKDSSRGI